MDNPYLQVISYVERIHRQFLEVVKLELEQFGIHDINNVQAMMLFNIGDAEMTVGGHVRQAGGDSRLKLRRCGCSGVGGK